MSDTAATEKKPATFEELQQKYGQLAFTAGSLQYEIVQKQKDLNAYFDAMRDISLEAAALKAKEAPAEAPKLESVQ